MIPKWSWKCSKDGLWLIIEGDLSTLNQLSHPVGEVLHHIEDVDTQDLQAPGVDIDPDQGLQDLTGTGMFGV